MNKVILIGNVGQDPDVRYTSTGQAVARFTLATADRWIPRAGGEQQERTEWHNIVAWGALAERVRDYVQKGKQLYVEGRLRTNSWTDTNGVRHNRIEVHAQNIILLGRRAEGEVAPSLEERGGVREVIDLDSNADFTVGDLGPPLDVDDMTLTPGEES